MPAPEGVRKRCLVAIDRPQGPLLSELLLTEDTTIAAALAEARVRLEAGPLACAIDWETSAVGVWGVRCGRHVVPAHGDRIELYRPLPDDPRQRRRQRVRARRT